VVNNAKQYFGIKKSFELSDSYAEDEDYWKNQLNIDYQDNSKEFENMGFDDKFDLIELKYINIHLTEAPKSYLKNEIRDVVREHPSTIKLLFLINKFQKHAMISYNIYLEFIDLIPKYKLVLANRNSSIESYDKFILLILFFHKDPNILYSLFLKSKSDSSNFKTFNAPNLTEEMKKSLIGISERDLVELSNSFIIQSRKSTHKTKFILAVPYNNEISYYFKVERSRGMLEKINETIYDTTVEWFIILIQKENNKLTLKLAGELSVGQLFLDKLIKAKFEVDVKLTEVNHYYTKYEIITFLENMLSGKYFIPIGIKFQSDLTGSPFVEISDTRSISGAINELCEIGILDITDVDRISNIKFKFKNDDKKVEFKIKKEKSRYQILMKGFGRRSNKVPIIEFIENNYNIIIKEGYT